MDLGGVRSLDRLGSDERVVEIVQGVEFRRLPVKLRRFFGVALGLIDHRLPVHVVRVQLTRLLELGEGGLVVALFESDYRRDLVRDPGLRVVLDRDYCARCS